jgi:SAM-dependent methyltransferase
VTDADIHAEIASYYAAKLAQHGETARGVDWNSEAGQEGRFEQLAKVLPSEGAFSVNDVGCGYGALLDFLAARYPSFDYCGCDISIEMIRAARARHPDKPRAVFAHGDQPPAVADFGLASGIFNVRLGHGDSEWRRYIDATLDVLDRTSRLGFAFNCLSAHCDPPMMRAQLYYADPAALFEHCRQRYSRRVALLHDTTPFEFTILVRKM